jgi:hypothetical protein
MRIVTVNTQAQPNQYEVEMIYMDDTEATQHAKRASE